MHHRSDHLQHPRPYVYDAQDERTLHFSISDIQSRMNLNHPNDLVLDYTKTMMGFMLFHDQPQKIAIIGLGGGSLAKFCYHYVPDTDIKVIEINPEVIALRDDFMVPADGQRFRVRQANAAEFIRTTRSRFDVLLVDGFDAECTSPELSSQQFFDDCFASLRDGGVMAVNLHPTSDTFRGLVHRINSSFPEPALLVKGKKSANCIAFAARGNLMAQCQPTGLRRFATQSPSAYKALLPAFALVLTASRARAPLVARRFTADE